MTLFSGECFSKHDAIKMKLLIISNTPHYVKNGVIAGWGPTVEEIDYLASIFDEVKHIAPLHGYPAPANASAYTRKNVIYIKSKLAGGDNIIDKVMVILQAPAWALEIIRELKKCDVAQVRCPSNISLVALFLLIFLRCPRKRWVKYAGNWGQKNPPVSYAVQRWILDHDLHRGVVTINGIWKNQKKHEISFLNPSLAQEEIVAMKGWVEKKTLSKPFNILFIGRLEEQKGPRFVVEATNILHKKGYDCRLNLIGGGELDYRNKLGGLVNRFNIGNAVNFLGWLPHNEVKTHLQDAHFLVLPSSSSEGWPKVLSEAFAYGAFCISSDVSSVRQILIDKEAGRIMRNISGDEIAGIIEEAVSRPDLWKTTIKNAYAKSTDFTYEKYLQRVKKEIIL